MTVRGISSPRPASTEPRSHKTTHANARLDIQVCPAMRPRGPPDRRHWRILRFLPYNTMHDGSLHSPAIHGIRISLQSHEPYRPIRSLYTLLRRRCCRWICSRPYHTTRCHQDAVTNARKRQGCGIEECLRSRASGKDHPPKRRIQRIFPWLEASNHHHDAQHCHLLVSSFATRLVCFFLTQRRSAYEMAKAFFIRRSTNSSTAI